MSRSSATESRTASWVPMDSYASRRTMMNWPLAITSRRRRDVIANGQFIMVRREAYESIGTHEAVRDSVAEDLLIAQRFLSEGKKLRAYWAEDLIATRMYTGLASMMEGWSKNIYLGGRATFPDDPILRALVPVA